MVADIGGALDCATQRLLIFRDAESGPYLLKKENMLNTEELLNVIVNALDDVKAKDIVVFDTTGKTSAFTRVVVCSGTSNRQTRALGMSVSRAVREAGGKVSGLEGSDTGEWVLVDCGEVVVHCMQPAMRSYYNLEELWGPESLDISAYLESLAEKSTHAPETAQ